MDTNEIPLWKLVLGVAGGVLLADLVRLAWMALVVSAAVQSWGVTFDNSGAITERPSAAARARTEPTPVYEGPITARARGISRACINGTIVHRSGNGWEQDLQNGRPQACRAKSR